MRLPLPMQAVQLLCSAVFGIVLGVYYDILRVLRRKRRYLTHLLDAWLWLTILLFCLLFAIYVGQGQFRLSFLPPIILGLWLWSVTLSKPFCRLFGAILRLVFLPIRLLLRFFKKYFKKTAKTLKKYFSSGKKWFMIKYTNKRKTRQCRKGGRADAVQKGILRDQNRDLGDFSDPVHIHGIPSETDQ